MSQVSYIRAAGDPDYNFAYSDFTVEFFVEAPDASGVQTLFEIANNESAAANLYTQTRFFTVLENGNLNAYAIQTVAPFMVGAGLTTFISPVPISPDSRIFYDGEFLTANEYVVSGTTITLNIAPNTHNNVLVEVGQVLFQIDGQEFTTGNVHFVSAERFQNQFYLFLDGQSQSAPVPAFNAIPSQVLDNIVGSGNVARYGSPALLTIGANKNGKDALFGKFGDFKITNGSARHVQPIQIQTSISSQFTDANLGSQQSAIEVVGGNFVDSISSYAPEEFVPGQMFDSLYLQVYQTTNDIAPPVPAVPPVPLAPNENVAWAFPSTFAYATPSGSGLQNANLSATQLAAFGRGIFSFSFLVGVTWNNFIPPSLPVGSVITAVYPVVIANGLSNDDYIISAVSAGVGVNPPLVVGNVLGIPPSLGVTYNGQYNGASLGTSISTITTNSIAASLYETIYNPTFDTNMNITFVGFAVYYTGSGNSITGNAEVLSFSLFKPEIMAGPTGSYSFTMPSTGNVVVPWESLDAAAASVVVNGTPINSEQWSVYGGILSIQASPGDSVEIIATGPTTYYDVCSNSVSTITSNVYANSTSIVVASTEPFMTPITTPNGIIRGQVFINQECITYLNIDRTNNILSGLLRGTSGTGVPAIHPAGSRIVAASENWDIQFLANVDPRTKIWYTIPLANTSLQNTNSVISTVLLDSGGLSPVTPF